MTPLMHPAVILAVLTMIGWAVLTVSVRATLYHFGFEPWSLAMAIQFFAGASLLAAAGVRSLPTEPIRRWVTWAIGGFRVVTTCAFTAALLHASAGRVNLLGSLNILLAAIGVFLVFGRRPKPVELLGFAAVGLGLVLLAAHLDGGFANPAIRFVLVSESAVVIASLLAERHPDNLGTVRQRLALTGFVTLFSAGGLLALWTMVSLAFPDTPLLPDAAHAHATIARPSLWGMALLLGAVLRGPSTYAAFEITARIGADGYMVSLAALPLLTTLVEWSLASFGLVASPNLTLVDLGVLALVGIGGAWIIVARYRR